MFNVAKCGDYAKSLYSKKMHEYNHCILVAVRYFNNGVYSHDLHCQVAKFLAAERGKKRNGGNNDKQLSLMF